MINIFTEAKNSELNGMGYRSRRFKILWMSSECSWNYFSIDYGIRWSDVLQIFPIQNVSDNGHRALMLGFWKLHITFSYSRKKAFNQDRYLPFRKTLWKFYQLVL